MRRAAECVRIALRDVARPLTEAQIVAAIKVMDCEVMGDIQAAITHLQTTNVVADIARPGAPTYYVLATSSQPWFIDGVRFDARLYRMIRRRGIDSIGDMTAYTLGELRSIPGIGPKKLATIVDSLVQRGESERQRSDTARYKNNRNEIILRFEEEEELGNFVARIDRLMCDGYQRLGGPIQRFDEIIQIMVANAEHECSEQGEEDGVDSDKPIDVLHLSKRAHNALKSRGIASLRELYRYPEVYLRGVPDVGKEAIREIVAYRRAHRGEGITLRQLRARFRGQDDFAGNEGKPVSALPPPSLSRGLEAIGITTLGQVAEHTTMALIKTYGLPAAEADRVASAFIRYKPFFLRWKRASHPR